MDKRTLWAMFIVFIVFIALQTFVFKPKPAQQPAQAADSLAKQAPAPIAAVPQQPAAPLPVNSASRYQGSDSLRTAILTNDRITVRFSSLGAQINSLELQDYTGIDRKTPVDLVPAGKALAGITLLGSNVGTDLKTLNWNLAQPSSDSLVFWLGPQDKPIVRKSFTLNESYGLRLNVTVQDSLAHNGIEYDFSAGIADSEKVKPKSKNVDYKLLLYAANKLEKLPLGRMLKNRPAGPLDSFKWAALRTKYFALALCEMKPQLIRNYKSQANPDTGNPSIVLDSYDRNPSTAWEQNFLLYAGPADYDILKAYTDLKLELIPDRGPSWLWWLSNAIAWLLKFLHSFIPNYGVVIVIFSIILKIVLHPLTHKSMNASLKMQKIQPRVQALQAKYKSDPKTLQMELSKLYKEAGASPMSGCLPLLLQMPIFFSLYAVLRYTMDMRNASFGLWLKDLSEPDPLYILPIVMAGFMILQSLMSRPAQAAIDQMDEKQKAMQSSTKMMTWLMPVMMFFIFMGLPSGLVLYYTVFNILSVAQQYYLQKHLKQKES